MVGFSKVCVVLNIYWICDLSVLLFFVICCFLAGKDGVSGVVGFSFARGRKPHAKLNRRTKRGRRTAAANMSIWIVNSDLRGSPDQAVGLSSGRGPGLCCGRLGSLDSGSIRVLEAWPNVALLIVW